MIWWFLSCPSSEIERYHLIVGTARKMIIIAIMCVCSLYRVQFPTIYKLGTVWWTTCSFVYNGCGFYEPLCQSVINKQKSFFFAFYSIAKIFNSYCKRKTLFVFLNCSKTFMAHPLDALTFLISCCLIRPD